MTEKFIRMTDEEAGEMLKKIAAHDRRTEGNVTALLIRERYATLFSQPSDARIAEAIKAGEPGAVAG